LATFNPDPVPLSPAWTIQWKNNLSKLVAALRDFFADPEFPSVQTDSLYVDGNVYVTGTVEIEEDLSAEDAAFSGQLNVGEDISAGGFILGENSRILIGPFTPSGTSFTLANNIPPWVGKIVFIFKDLSLSGTANFLLQFGTPVPVTSGYVSTALTIADAAASQVASSTAGFLIRVAVAASSVSGIYTFYLLDPSTNKWSGGGEYERDTNRACSCGGSVTLPGVVTSLTLTSTGADTIDAGTVMVRLEY
jgi:hypothetical protein